MSDLDVAIREIDTLEKRNKVLSHNLDTANDIIITMQEEITKLKKMKSIALEMVCDRKSSNYVSKFCS